MNKNGFVLAEAIIVSVFVIGSIAYIALNLLPLISKYEKVLNYDDIQDVYIANDIYEEFILNEMVFFPSSYGGAVSGLQGGSSSLYKGDNPSNKCICLESFLSSCFFSNDMQQILEKFNIKEAVYYSSTYPPENTDSFSRGMREYYEYCKNNIENFNTKTLLLFKIENSISSNSYTYAYVEVK